MTLLDAISCRHSVRHYDERPIAPAAVEALQQAIDACNSEGDLHIQLVLDEPKAFKSWLVHYGAFSGVRNYIALIGRKADDLSERVGYYGERLVLLAQQLGLNTCWVALTYSKRMMKTLIDEGEKCVCVISLGYGTTQGHSHRIKRYDQVTDAGDDAPQWFKRGVEAALLAPTAINQQQFKFSLLPPNKVKAKAKLGFYSSVDLGIVKLHFEIGAGRDNFEWA